MHRLPRVVELLLALALCALIAFWITRVFRGDPLGVPPTVAMAAPDAGMSRADAVLASARLFGSRPPGALSDNVRALGVVADTSGHGSVIVSVDGQAPKVYRVGDTLDGRLVAAIRPDQIELEAGGARQVFRLPAAPTSAQGLVVGGGAAAPGMAIPQAAPGMPAAVPPDLPPGASTAPVHDPMEKLPEGNPAGGRFQLGPPGSAPPNTPPPPSWSEVNTH